MISDELVADVVREGLGRRVVAVERMRGGSKKGAYRVGLDDGASAMLYVWAGEENFWPDDDEVEPFAHASGFELFEASHRRLSEVGVRVPRVYLADRERNVALVEDVRGGKLEDDMNPAALRRLGVMLREMWGHGSPRLGKVAYCGAADGAAEEEPARAAEGIVLRRALRDLGEAAGRVGRIGVVRGRLDERVRELAGRVGERRDYRLIHGELGPDHVLLDEQGEPVVIDIEGLMYFDLEWEHVFLRLRFGDRYRYLETEGLDEDRMRFYALAMRLSLVAGPLRLLDGDFPEREGMLEIVRHNTDRVLQGLA